MNKLLLLLTLLLTVYGCQNQKGENGPNGTNMEVFSDKYIVFLKEAFAEPLIKSIDTNLLVIDAKSMDPKRTELKDSVQRYFKRKGIEVEIRKIFVDVAVGAVLYINPNMVALLRADSAIVSSIIHDIKIDMNADISINPIQQTDPRDSDDPLKRWLSPQLLATQINPIQQNRDLQDEYDIIPSGSSLVTRAISVAGGPVPWTSTERRRIWILDTGIDPDNTYLNVDASVGTFFVGNSINDDNGHGTFCAGIAAGRPVGDEGFPLIHYGLSEGAPVVPVKVLDQDGKGDMSNVLLGLDWVAIFGNRNDVANLSLGAYDIGNSYDVNRNDCYSLDVRRLIQRLSIRGIFVTMAAGNNAGNAKSNLPGCVTGPASRIFTISSVNADLTCAEYANFNVTVPPSHPVEFVTVGTRVFSLWDNGGFRMASGTSVSSALVAGIIHARGSRPAAYPDLIYCVGTSKGPGYKLARH